MSALHDDEVKHVTRRNMVTSNDIGYLATHCYSNAVMVSQLMKHPSIPQQNSFQTCNHYIQSPFYQLPAIPYFTYSLSPNVRSLRSSDQHYLLLTPSSTNFGSRSFRCSTPAIWNSIPLEIRQFPTIGDFIRNLKTHFFSPPPV